MLTREQRLVLRLYSREGFDKKQTLNSLMDVCAVLIAEQIGNDCITMACVDCNTPTQLDRESMSFFCPKCKMAKPIKPITLLQHLQNLNRRSE